MLILHTGRKGQAMKQDVCLVIITIKAIELQVLSSANSTMWSSIQCVLLRLRRCPPLCPRRSIRTITFHYYPHPHISLPLFNHPHIVSFSISVLHSFTLLILHSPLTVILILTCNTFRSISLATELMFPTNL